MELYHTCPLSVFSSLHAQYTSPINRTTELHLEQLSCRVVRAFTCADEPAVNKLLLSHCAQNFVAFLDSGHGLCVEAHNIAQLVDLIVARRQRYGDWVTKMINITATIQEDRSHAVVWLSYNTQANGQTIHREMVTRLLWRCDAGNNKWLCYRCDYIRGPGMHVKDGLDIDQ
jgi:hypothetical protein